MGVKEFLKPSKGKILTTLLLFGISLFFVFLAYILYPFSEILFFPLFLAMILYVSIIPLIFFIPFNYLFACYIIRNKKWLKNIIIYLIAFMIFSVALFFAIMGYNYTFARFCNADSDCFVQEGGGISIGQVFNDKYIPLANPYGTYGGGQVDITHGYGICENNRCRLFMCAIDVVFNVESVCKSGNDYKVLIKNDGKKGIISWEVRLWQTAKKVERTYSSTPIKAGESAQITVTPENVTEVRMVEAIPIIKIADKEITCAQTIESYGNLEGAPITEECEK